MTKDDLIMAFFPCIYFTGSTNPCYYTLENTNYRKMTTEAKFKEILERSEHRQMFYALLYKMVAVCYTRHLRLVIENPFSSTHYLHNNFLKEPDYVDKDRTLRGDYFVKPTGYWYFNCKPTQGYTYTPNAHPKQVWKAKGAKQAGLCSEERSMISPLYAHNFIIDKILGETQKYSQLNLFD